MHDKHGDVSNGQGTVTAVRTMAGMLSERGFDVRRPSRAISFCMTVANAKSARCLIDIDGNDRLGWEFRPGDAAEPAEISSVVMRVLGKDDNGLGLSYRHLYKGVTLKGAVGREMQARGLSVRLNTYEDTVFFESVSEVEIANPGRPDRGVVFVGDDGSVQWEYLDYRSEAGVMAAVADTTAQVLIPGQPPAR